MAKQDLSVILNVIRATASSAYQSTVPMATADNIKDVGAAVLAAPQAIRNEFMTNLYNKIGLTLIDSPVIENDFSFLKKGTLEYGQTIEDIYVGLASSEPYITGMNAGENPPDPFAIRKLPHYSAFYSTILARQYHVTRHLTDLKKAFHNAGGVEQFVAGMMNSLISAENYDDMRATIGLIAKQIEAAQTAENFNGNVHLITDYNALYDKEVDADTCWLDKDFIKYFANQLKKYSKRLRHLRSDLNIAGVPQVLPQSRQRIMMLEDVTVDFETELMAWAYHADRFILRGVDEIDAWYSIGADHSATPVVTPESIKVKTQFTTKAAHYAKTKDEDVDEDKTYYTLAGDVYTEVESPIKANLGTYYEIVSGSTMCVAIIYDEDMVKIYNKERIASEQGNAKGNYWNMFMSLEDIYACSPYKNFVCFMLD